MAIKKGKCTIIFLGTDLIYRFFFRSSEVTERTDNNIKTVHGILISFLAGLFSDSLADGNCWFS